MKLAAGGVLAGVAALRGEGRKAGPWTFECAEGHRWHAAGPNVPAEPRLLRGSEMIRCPDCGTGSLVAHHDEREIRRLWKRFPWEWIA